MIDNNKNMSKKIFAARFEQNFGATEVSGKKVWKNFGHFKTLKSGYNMETVNNLKNTVYYLNQTYLTVQKNKKIYYGNLYIRSDH